MMLCLTCHLQRPNSYKSHTCPDCGAYLKYIEDDAKNIAVKMYEAGIRISYAVAELYSYANNTIHTANISIGMANPYPATVFRMLPDGYVYVFPEVYTPEYLSKIPLAQVISPTRTYVVLQYEAEYPVSDEAKSALRQKLLELEMWVDDAIEDGWFSICHLASFWL